LVKIHSIYNGYILEDLNTKHLGEIMKFINKYIKWASTALILSGIVLTSINFYPLNIFVHGAGSLGWTIVGYVNKDRALMVNFGIQIPIFALGYAKVFF
jgi:hypothetical protein